MKRRLRFKLRTLLVLMLATSVLLGLFAIRMRSAERQRAAVRRVTEQGGAVLYEHQVHDDGTQGYIRSYVPGFLLALLGQDLFYTVRGVDFSQASLGEPIDLSTVRPFSDLRSVTLAPSCDDEALATLPTMPELRLIFAADTLITDAGLDAFLRQPKLRYPIVGWSRVTGEGLHRLATAPSLRWLAVDASQLDEEGVAALAAIPKLEWLWIDGDGPLPAPLDHLDGVRWLTLQGVTDVRIAEDANFETIESIILRALPEEDLDRVCELLPRMKSLRRLEIDAKTYFDVRPDIARNSLNERHLRAIARVDRLEVLRVRERTAAGPPRLSDDSFSPLFELENLEYLRLSATPECLDQFREELPDCDVGP